VFDIWWSYYQCEPFGSQWEQTASLATVIHGNTAMLAATKGIKTDAFGVIDFMPSDSMKWIKRTKRRRRAITRSQAQTPIIMKAFGF